MRARDAEIERERERRTRDFADLINEPSACALSLGSPARNFKRMQPVWPTTPLHYSRYLCIQSSLITSSVPDSLSLSLDNLSHSLISISLSRARYAHVLALTICCPSCCPILRVSLSLYPQLFTSVYYAYYALCVCKHPSLLQFSKAYIVFFGNVMKSCHCVSV